MKPRASAVVLCSLQRSGSPVGAAPVTVWWSERFRARPGVRSAWHEAGLELDTIHTLRSRDAEPVVRPALDKLDRSPETYRHLVPPCPTRTGITLTGDLLYWRSVQWVRHLLNALHEHPTAVVRITVQPDYETASAVVHAPDAQIHNEADGVAVRNRWA